MKLTKFIFRGVVLVREVFIETGTYKGDSVLYACNAGFKTLHSIEVCEENYRDARERVMRVPNIRIHHGTSPEVLPKIMDGSKATTFFLDAHYQGLTRTEQCPKYGECPLLAELAAIRAVEWKTPPYILIDDSHLFLKNNRDYVDIFDDAQWPTVEKIQEALGDDYVINEQTGILYCLPKDWAVPILMS